MEENKKKRSYVSLIWMIIISIIIQVLSIMKSSTVAGIFGAGFEMDAYNFANSISTFIFGIIASGIPTIILPRYIKNNDKNQTNAFITIIYSFIFIFVFILLLLRRQLIDLLSNRNEAFVSLTSSLLVCILLSQYLLSFTNITIAYFQSKQKFIIPKIVSLLSQLIIVIVLLCIDSISINTYALLIASGVVFNFIFDLIIAIVFKWKFTPIFKFDSETKQLFRQFLPILLSSGIYQLSLFVDSMIAGLLEEGQITLLSYSTQISSMVNSLIIGNILIYIYPKIINSVKEKTENVLWNKCLSLHIISCLLTCGFFAIGQEGIDLLYLKGEITSNDTKVIYTACLIYIFGQQFSSIRDLIYKFFYANENTRKPAFNSILVTITNISLSVVFVLWFGFYGIIIGTVLSSIISLCTIVVIYNKMGYSMIGFKNNLLLVLKNLLILIITSTTIFFIKKYIFIENRMLSILVFGGLTVLIYFLLELIINKKALLIFKHI